MKKTLLVLAAFFAFGVAANAQDDKSSGMSSAGMVKFGPKAGLNIATVSEDNTKALVGFHIGGFAEIMLNDKFAIQPEVLYSAQGAKADVGNGEWKLGYINVPVMAKYFVAEGFSVEAGPQIGFLMTAEDEDGHDFKDSFETTDFGFNFGAGYALPMGLMFQARYCLGLSDIAKNNSGDAVKNGVFQLSVGYKF